MDSISLTVCVSHLCGVLATVVRGERVVGGLADVPAALVEGAVQPRGGGRGQQVGGEEGGEAHELDGAVGVPLRCVQGEQALLRAHHLLHRERRSLDIAKDGDFQKLKLSSSRGLHGGKKCKDHFFYY